MAEIAKRVDALIKDTTDLLDRIEEEGESALGEATARSWKKVHRFDEARDELQVRNRREGSLQGELADLPLRHSRALLADDEAEAAAVKARHTEIKEELAELAQRRPELEREIATLGGPNVGNLPEHLQFDGARLHQWRDVSRSLDSTLGRLATLEREVAVVIRKMQDRFNRKAIETGSVSQEISNTIYHDPEVRRRAEERKGREIAASPHLSARSTGK